MLRIPCGAGRKTRRWNRQLFSGAPDADRATNPLTGRAIGWLLDGAIAAGWGSVRSAGTLFALLS